MTKKMSADFKRAFWNQKILSWEQHKYKSLPQWLDVNKSVKRRLNLAASVLGQMPPGKSLLELGCGSGLLWEQVKEFPIKNYKAVDFSETAIRAFQHKIQNIKSGQNISLSCEDCLENIYPSDIVISLGLLDWLSIEEIKKIAKNYKDRWYLHSFSEKRLSLSQTAHFFYSLYNYRRNNYFPRYRKTEELHSFFGSKAGVYRDSGLSFSTFIYCLPAGVKIKCYTDPV